MKIGPEPDLQELPCVFMVILCIHGEIMYKGGDFVSRVRLCMNGEIVYPG